jgi:hypothetical protein
MARRSLDVRGLGRAAWPAAGRPQGLEAHHLDELIALQNPTAWRWISRILLFHSVCAGWVFFRASSFADAFDVFGRLAVPGAVTLASAPVCVVLFLGLAGQYMPSRWRNAFEIELGRWPALARGAALAVAVAPIEILGPSGVAPFIYFRF